MSLKHLDHYSLTTPPSIYDEEALTALELAGRTAAKVNDIIDFTLTEHKNQNNKLEKIYDSVPENVDKWLYDHPEVTTTVQDHELSIDKMIVGTLGYVTPSMFGASAAADIATNDAALTAAIAYIAANKDTTLIFDASYTFTCLDLTGIANITVAGKNKGVTITLNGNEDGKGIIVTAGHNTFKDIRFHTTKDITLLDMRGSYGIFNNCHFFGPNNGTAIGCHISEKWAVTFTDCSIREFKTNIMINALYVSFVNTIIVGSDQSLDSTIIISGGSGIMFTNCDIEKGEHIMEVTDGQVMFNNNFFEGASSTEHFLLKGGRTVFTGNRMLNNYILKNADNDLIMVNNYLNYSAPSSYVLRCLDENIGYLVIENNFYGENINFFIRLSNHNPGQYGLSNAGVYYSADGTTWAKGQLNKYVSIRQEHCYSISAKGDAYANFTSNAKTVYGGAYYREHHTSISLAKGDYWFETDTNRFYIYRGDSLWVTPTPVFDAATTLPNSPVIGQGHFINGRPVWYNGTNWVDATGATV